MLDVILIVDTADERNRLVARAKSPLACIGREPRTKLVIATKGEGTSVPGLGLPGVLLRMTFPARWRACVLAGCCLEQQSGQYKTANYQISLPLN